MLRQGHEGAVLFWRCLFYRQKKPQRSGAQSGPPGRPKNKLPDNDT